MKPTVDQRWPQAIVAALIVFSFCPSLAAPLRANDEPDGEHDGLEDVPKDAKGNPIFAKDEKGQNLVEKQCGQRINNICNAGKFGSADDERFFSEFFEVKIGEFTWTEKLEQLPDLRSKFKRYFTAPAAAPDVHDWLNKLVLDRCKKIAANARYPRAVRVKSMLLIGELNQQEKRSGDLTSVVPLTEARSYLVTSANNAALHDSLRIAAMVGLERHAATNSTADVRRTLKDPMLSLLKAKAPPPGKKRLGHDWLRMNAADLLGVLASEGDEADQPEVAKAILAMAAEADLGLWMRCQVVGNLGDLDKKSFPAETVLPAARQLAKLVVDISTLTKKRPADTAKTAAGKTAAGKTAAGKAAAAPAGDVKKGDAAKKNDKKAGDKRTADKKTADKKKKEVKPDEKNAAPPDPLPPVRLPAQVRKVTSEELTFCLSRVRFALTGEIPVKLSAKAAESALTGGLGAAANDANQRDFIIQLVKSVDDMLKITRDGKSNLADLEIKRADLEKWLETVSAAGPADGTAVVGKNRPSPAAGSGKRKGDLDAAVGSK